MPRSKDIQVNSGQQQDYGVIISKQQVQEQKRRIRTLQQTINILRKNKQDQNVIMNQVRQDLQQNVKLKKSQINQMSKDVIYLSKKVILLDKEKSNDQQKQLNQNVNIKQLYRKSIQQKQLISTDFLNNLNSSKELYQTKMSQLRKQHQNEINQLKLEVNKLKQENSNLNNGLKTLYQLLAANKQQIIKIIAQNQILTVEITLLNEKLRTQQTLTSQLQVKYEGIKDQKVLVEQKTIQSLNSLLFSLDHLFLDQVLSQNIKQLKLKSIQQNISHLLIRFKQISQQQYNLTKQLKQQTIKNQKLQSQMQTLRIQAAQVSGEKVIDNQFFFLRHGGAQPEHLLQELEKRINKYHQFIDSQMAKFYQGLN